MPLALDDAAVDLRAADEVFPATVTVTRTSEADYKSRQLIVWLDGQRTATLLWGDSVTSELPPGPHRLRVSNTLVWKTIDFTLAPGEQAFFEAINRTGPGSIVIAMLLGVGPLYLTVKQMA